MTNIPHPTYTQDHEPSIIPGFILIFITPMIISILISLILGYA